MKSIEKWIRNKSVNKCFLWLFLSFEVLHPQMHPKHYHQYSKREGPVWPIDLLNPKFTWYLMIGFECSINWTMERHLFGSFQGYWLAGLRVEYPCVWLCWTNCKTGGQLLMTPMWHSCHPGTKLEMCSREVFSTWAGNTLGFLEVTPGLPPGMEWVNCGRL